VTNHFSSPRFNGLKSGSKVFLSVEGEMVAANLVWINKCPYAIGMEEEDPMLWTARVRIPYIKTKEFIPMYKNPLSKNVLEVPYYSVDKKARLFYNETESVKERIRIKMSNSFMPTSKFNSALNFIQIKWSSIKHRILNYWLS
jgi:hypothetical protein